MKDEAIIWQMIILKDKNPHGYKCFIDVKSPGPKSQFPVLLISMHDKQSQSWTYIKGHENPSNILWSDLP